MQVTRGQQIAQVGDTGDSPLVHLHFQICDGPDPLAARSIPFRFTDMTSDDSDLGTYVTFCERTLAEVGFADIDDDRAVGGRRVTPVD